MDRALESLASMIGILIVMHSLAGDGRVVFAARIEAEIHRFRRTIESIARFIRPVSCSLIYPKTIPALKAPLALISVSLPSPDGNGEKTMARWLIEMQTEKAAIRLDSAGKSSPVAIVLITMLGTSRRWKRCGHSSDFLPALSCRPASKSARRQRYRCNDQALGGKTPEGVIMGHNPYPISKRIRASPAEGMRVARE